MGHISRFFINLPSAKKVKPLHNLFENFLKQISQKQALASFKF